jgi:hypothetical protein
MKNPRKFIGLLSVLILSVTLVACGSPNSTEPVSANAASWSTQDKDSLTNSCLDWQNEPSKTFCECFTSSVAEAYSIDEFKDASELMNQTGTATKAYEEAWNVCDRKFGAVEEAISEESTQPEQQANYPTCVQVLAPGNSGLSLADNDTELGRPDRQPGYCILPNSGGEKYYYQGRR